MCEGGECVNGVKGGKDRSTYEKFDVAESDDTEPAQTVAVDSVAS